MKNTIILLSFLVLVFSCSNSNSANTETQTEDSTEMNEQSVWRVSNSTDEFNNVVGEILVADFSGSMRNSATTDGSVEGSFVVFPDSTIRLCMYDYGEYPISEALYEIHIQDQKGNVVEFTESVYDSSAGCMDIINALSSYRLNGETYINSNLNKMHEMFQNNDNLKFYVESEYGTKYNFEFSTLGTKKAFDNFFKKAKKKS